MNKGKAAFDPAAPYPTTAEVTAYLASVRPGSPWETLSPAQQDAGVAQATLTMESLCWAGDRCKADQPYAWPRVGANCCDTELTCDALPKGIEVAFSELAAVLASNPTLLFGGAPATVPPGIYLSEERLGEMGHSFAAFPANSSSIKYTANAPLLLQKLPWMGELIGCWLVGKFGTARILSRC